MDLTAVRHTPERDGTNSWPPCMQPGLQMPLVELGVKVQKSAYNLIDVTSRLLPTGRGSRAGDHSPLSRGGIPTTTRAHLRRGPLSGTVRTKRN